MPLELMLNHSVTFMFSQHLFYLKEIKFLLEICITAQIIMSGISLLQLIVSPFRGKVISLGEKISSQLSQPLHLTTHSDNSRRMMK